MKKRTVEELRNALKKSVIEFEFTKMNGEKRKAKGTTNSNLIPSQFKVSGPRQKYTNDVIRFFDFTVNGYRSISVDADVTF